MAKKPARFPTPGHARGMRPHLDMPALILPSIQVSIRAGESPAPEANGVRYLRLPIDALQPRG